MDKEDREIYAGICFIVIVIIFFILCFCYQNKKLHNTFRQRDGIDVFNKEDGNIKIRNNIIFGNVPKNGVNNQ